MKERKKERERKKKKDRKGERTKSKLGANTLFGDFCPFCFCLWFLSLLVCFSFLFLPLFFPTLLLLPSLFFLFSVNIFYNAFFFLLFFSVFVLVFSCTGFTAPIRTKDNKIFSHEIMQFGI